VTVSREKYMTSAEDRPRAASNGIWGGCKSTRIACRQGLPIYIRREGLHRAGVAQVHARIKEHTGEQVRVVVRFDDEEVSFDVARGENDVLPAVP
jgi:hypothetical protein